MQIKLQMLLDMMPYIKIFIFIQFFISNIYPIGSIEAKTMSGSKSEECKRSIYRVILGSLPKTQINGALLGFSVPLISSIWNISATPVTINSIQFLIQSSMKIDKNPFYVSFSSNGSNWTTLVSPISHDTSINYLKLNVISPDETEICIEKQFTAKYLKIVVVSLDDFLFKSTRIILCPNVTMSFGEEFQSDIDDIHSVVITSLANSSSTVNHSNMSIAIPNLDVSYSKINSKSSDESERREKISHPIDGRLLHYDMEEYDPEHEEALVMDRSLLSNDGLLKGKAQIKDQHGSCRHTLVLSEPEDRLEFYASNFIYRPKSIISIHVLIKPNRTDNRDGDDDNSIQTIFEVLGERIDAVFSRISLELLPHGVLRWSHRNESDNTVFNVSTPRRSIRYGFWNQIVASYNIVHGLIGESRIIVNGSEEALGSGYGYISKDWDRYSAIGKDHYGNHFIGQIDEFVVFDRLLHPEEIDSMFKKCDSKKYYSGGKVWALNGAILSPHYPKMYKGPVESSWIINGVSGEIIEIFIDELQIGSEEESSESKSRSCDRSSLLVKERSGGVVLGSYCSSIRHKTLRSKGNQISILFATAGESSGIKFRIEFSRVKRSEESKRSKTAEEHSTTSHCHSEHKSYAHKINTKQLVYLKKIQLPSNDLGTCISSACEGKIFDWALLEDDQCYGAYCEDSRNNITFNCTYIDTVPVSIASGNPKDVVVKLNLTDKRTWQDGDIMETLGNANNSKKKISHFPPISHHLSHFQQPRKKSGPDCSFGPSMQNLVLSSGKDAGNFSYFGETPNIESCQVLVCANNEKFDVIIWWRNRCFSVKCNNTRTCMMRPGFTLQFKQRRNIFLISFRLEMWKRITKESLVEPDSYLQKGLLQCEDGFWPSSSFAVKNVRIVPKSIASGIKFSILTIDQSLEACQNLCCSKASECDAIFMSDSLCYMISCDEAVSSNSESTNCVLIGEKIYIHENNRDQGSSSPKAFSNILIPTSRYIQSHSGMLQCKITRVSLNSRLKYGLNSGRFVDLGRVDGISQCAQMACQADSSVVLLLNDLCFGVSCYTEESCQDVSIMSNSEAPSHAGLAISSTIAFLGDTEMRQHNALSSSLDFLASFENTFKIRKSIGKQLMVGKQVGVLEDCNYGEIFQAIMMKFSKKDSKTLIGSRKNIIECGVECCALDWCKLAYLQGSDCYASRCEEPGSCVVRMLHNENALSTVMYMPRHKSESYKNQGLLLSRKEEVSRHQNMCSSLQYDRGLTINDVVMTNNEKQSKIQMNLLGLTPDLKICMRKCCEAIDPPCDTVYLVGLSCFGMVCGPDFTDINDESHSTDHYSFSDSEDKNRRSKIISNNYINRCSFEPNSSVTSVLAMQFLPHSNSRNLKLSISNVESWLIYIFCGGILGISAIIGILLVVSMYLKRRKLQKLYQEYQMIE